jgi:hypothetical protein
MEEEFSSHSLPMVFPVEVSFLESRPRLQKMTIYIIDNRFCSNRKLRICKCPQG